MSSFPDALRAGNGSTQWRNSWIIFRKTCYRAWWIGSSLGQARFVGAQSSRDNLFSGPLPAQRTEHRRAVPAADSVHITMEDAWPPMVSNRVVRLRYVGFGEKRKEALKQGIFEAVDLCDASRRLHLPVTIRMHDRHGHRLWAAEGLTAEGMGHWHYFPDPVQAFARNGRCGPVLCLHR